MLELSKEQQQREADALSRAHRLYWDGIREQRALGEEASLPPMTALLRNFAPAVAKRLDEWCAQSKVLRAHSIEAQAIAIVLELGTIKAAAIGMASVMKKMSRLPLPAAGICNSIGTAVMTELSIINAADAEPALIASALKGLKGGGDRHRQKVLTVLSRSVAGQVAPTRKLAFQVGFGILNAILTGCPVFVSRMMRFEGKQHTSLVVDAAGPVTEWVEHLLAQREASDVGFPVMVVKPRPWMPGIGGGYRFDLAEHLKLFGRARGSRASDEVYEALNTAQDVPWQVNDGVYDVMRHLIVERAAIGGLPDTYIADATKPLYPEGGDADAKRAWKKEAKAWHYSRAKAISAAAQVSMFVAETDSVRQHKSIYFPHRLDFRGRLYAATAALTPQGSDFQKAALKFERAVPIGDGAGLFWLAMHGANCMAKCPQSGLKLDKLPFEERVAWVTRNAEMIRAVARDWASTAHIWTAADAPFQFLAFCQEWAGYLDQGASFESALPVAFDGSCNGLQHYAALLRDPVTAAAVNVLPSDAPKDVYQIVADRFIEHLGFASRLGEEVATFWLGSGQIDRGLVKRPVMTLSYGVSEFGVGQQLREELQDRGFEFTSEQVNWLAKAFYRTLYQSVPAAMNAMTWLQKAAKVIAEGNAPVRWTTPSGFTVHQHTPKRLPDRIRLYWMRQPVFLGLRKDGKPDSRAAANAIAPNVIHSFDAAHLTKTINRLKGEGVNDVHLIHDSFGVHAANVPILFNALRSTFADIYSEDAWGKLCAELQAQTDKPLPPPPMVGDLDVNAVRGSRYFFA